MHKVSYMQTDSGQCSLSLWHHNVQFFSSAASSWCTLPLRDWSSRSPTVIWLPLLISSCSGKGPGLSSTDDRVLSCTPESCPMLPSFTAGITQRDYGLSTSASRWRPKPVKGCQFSASLCPAAVRGRQHFPISTAEGAAGHCCRAHSLVCELPVEEMCWTAHR